MNCLKATIAFIALVAVSPAFIEWHSPTIFTLIGLLLSGLIGLNVADLCLLKAFTKLGVARTLILFGFQPLFVGIAAYYLFDQTMNPIRLLAVVFLIACLFTFSLERYRIEKRWEISGLGYALAGVGLDTCGILLTRASFGASPDVTPIEGHLIRCVGALGGFAIISIFRPIGLVKGFLAWPAKTRLLLIAASLGGTFLSLIFYLTALKIGHLASIAGVAITGPMLAAGLESLVHRRAPSPYFLVAFMFFGVGFAILWLAP